MPSHATLVSLVLALLAMVSGAALWILSTMAESTREVRREAVEIRAMIHKLEVRAHDHRLGPHLTPGALHDNP